MAKYRTTLQGSLVPCLDVLLGLGLVGHVNRDDLKAAVSLELVHLQLFSDSVWWPLMSPPLIHTGRSRSNRPPLAAHGHELLEFVLQDSGGLHRWRRHHS